MGSGQFRDDQFDVVLDVAVELFELVEGHESPVDAEGFVAVVAGPVGERFMVAFAAPDEGSAEIDSLGFARFEESLQALG